MGSSYKETVKLAIANGFTFLRKAKGDHEIWANSRGQRLMLTTASRSTPYKLIHVRRDIEKYKKAVEKQ